MRAQGGSFLTTTDYNVAIEAIASGQAQMALLGAEGYVQANKKNPAVQAAFTNSDEDGKLDGACYYSRICVRAEDADQYKSGGGYSLDNVKGKSFSFVSATSTSGFKVPSSAVVEHFGLDSSDELLEAGGFFSEVLFGNSHQGSAVNLLSGDADAAAFDDVDVDMYLDLVSGEANTVGAVYKAKDDADAPFDAVRGKEFVIVAITPVLNAPICFNEDAISEEDRTSIVEYFCSDAVANDSSIFVDPEDENAKGIFEKTRRKRASWKWTTHGTIPSASWAAWHDVRHARRGRVRRARRTCGMRDARRTRRACELRIACCARSAWIWRFVSGMRDAR